MPPPISLSHKGPRYLLQMCLRRLSKAQRPNLPKRVVGALLEPGEAQEVVSECDHVVWQQWCDSAEFRDALVARGGGLLSFLAAHPPPRARVLVDAVLGTLAEYEDWIEFYPFILHAALGLSSRHGCCTTDQGDENVVEHLLSIGTNPNDRLDLSGRDIWIPSRTIWRDFVHKLVQEWVPGLIGDAHHLGRSAMNDSLTHDGAERTWKRIGSMLDHGADLQAETCLKNPRCIWTNHSSLLPTGQRHPFLPAHAILDYLVPDCHKSEWEEFKQRNLGSISGGDSSVNDITEQEDASESSKMRISSRLLQDCRR